LHFEEKIQQITLKKTRYKDDDIYASTNEMREWAMFRNKPATSVTTSMLLALIVPLGRVTPFSA